MCTNCIGQSCNNIAPALDVSDEDTQATVPDISVKDISPDDEDSDDLCSEQLNDILYWHNY